MSRRYDDLLGRGSHTKLAQLRTAHFGTADDDAFTAFLDALFGVDVTWVILKHHGAFVDWWRTLMHSQRIHTTSADGKVVHVRYTCTFIQVNGSPLVGDAYYPLVQMAELVATMLLTGAVGQPDAHRFASVFDVPLVLVQALLLPSTPATLYDTFCRDWVELGAHDMRFIELYRTRPEALEQFYLEPLSPSSSSGAVMLRDYGRLMTANKLGEWWSRQRRCAGTSLVVTLYALFDLECERLVVLRGGGGGGGNTLRDEMAVAGVARLQRLFPLALSIALDADMSLSTTTDANAQRLAEQAPTITAMIQEFVNAARVFMVDQLADVRSASASEMFTGSLWRQAREACATLRNIRTCLDPRVEAMERFEHASWAQASADSHSRDGRVQRMVHHAAARCSVYNFVYATLLGELNNIIETTTVVRWLHSSAFFFARTGVPQTCTLAEATADPAAEKVRATVRMVDEHFVALTFFGTPDGWPAATLFSLRCTMKALQTQFHEIGLADTGSHYMGHCQYGPYLILERQALWMVMHAASTLALLSQQRCFQKSTPFYAEMMRVYFSRMDMRDAKCDALRAAPRTFSYLWVHDAAYPSPPATLHPNLFSHMCFINTLGEWLDIPHETVNGHRWRLAVPPPETPGFAATRMLHRLVDQIYQGAVATLVSAGHTSYQYWLDDDDLALNAIKSFLQLEAPHTVSLFMLQILAGACERQPERFAELSEVIRAVDAKDPACRRHVREWVAAVPDAARARLRAFTSNDAAAVSSSSSSSSASASAASRKRSRSSILDSLLSTPVQPPSSNARPTAAPRTRARTDLANMDIGAERERTDRATAEMLVCNALDQVDEETREYSQTRVALLPTQRLLDQLSPSHSLRRLAAQGAEPRRLLAHLNLLMYEPVLCNLLDPPDARRLACDMQVGGRPIAGSRLFAQPRYSGAREDALRNFRVMHSAWESMILDVQDDPTGRLLAYTTNEPRDQLYTLCRHLDFRHTLGDTSPGHGINVAIDTVLAGAAPTDHFLPPTTAVDDGGGGGGGGGNRTPTELPVCMTDADHPDRPHLYPSTSMVLITTVGETQLAEHIRLYNERWEFAAHIATVTCIDVKARALHAASPICNQWTHRLRSLAREREAAIHKERDKEDMALRAASADFDAAMAYLGLT